MVARTIIVPLDGSEFAERAVGVAEELARRVDGRMVLLSAAKSGFDASQAYLDKIAGTVTDVPVDAVVIHDRTPAGAIRLLATEEPGRIVCMTTHGRGGLRWAMLGSVAEEAIRAATGPVLLVGRRCAPDWAATPGSLLVGLDGSERSELVVADAADWCGALGLELRAAIVIHPLDVDDAEHPEHLLEPIRERLHSCGAQPEIALLRASFPAGALVDYADTLPAALMAVTAHARSGLARVALGSVTMGVVSLARCPVLVAHTT